MAAADTLGEYIRTEIAICACNWSDQERSLAKQALTLATTAATATLDHSGGDLPRAKKTLDTALAYINIAVEKGAISSADGRVKLLAELECLASPVPAPPLSLDAQDTFKKAVGAAFAHYLVHEWPGIRASGYFYKDSSYPTHIDEHDVAMLRDGDFSCLTKFPQYCKKIEPAFGLLVRAISIAYRELCAADSRFDTIYYTDKQGCSYLNGNRMFRALAYRPNDPRFRFQGDTVVRDDGARVLFEEPGVHTPPIVIPRSDDLLGDYGFIYGPFRIPSHPATDAKIGLQVIP